MIERIVSAKAETARIGIDQHARELVVVIKLDGSVPQRAHTMSEAQLLELAGALKRGGLRVSSVYEAGPCGFGLHRKLAALGMTNRVIAPKQLGDGKSQKTDALDARALVELLDSYERGNTKAMTPVYVPTEKQEQERSRGRLRETFKRERLRLEQSGRSAMLAQGFHITGKWWGPKRWEKLKSELPEWLADNLGKLREAIAKLDELERGARKELEAQAPALLPKGVGALSWVQLFLEMCEWERFKNRRQVSSYTGLCPGIHQTGMTLRNGCINRHGNPRVRMLLIELVWRLVRWQPDYPPVRALVEGAVKAGAKRKLAVAAARKLAVDLWRLSTGQTTPEKIGLRMDTPV